MFQHELGGGAVLRLFEARDVEPFFALVQENRMGLREWLPWVDDLRAPADAQEFIRQSLRKYADNGAFDAGIWQSGRLAGSIGFHPVAWANRNVGIGYWLGHHARGNGLVTRACAALLEHAFVSQRLHRVEIRCATGNLKSQRIPRRLGFTEEGIARQSEWVSERFVDHVVFSLLKQEWTALVAGSPAPPSTSRS